MIPKPESKLSPPLAGRAFVHYSSRFLQPVFIQEILIVVSSLMHIRLPNDQEADGFSIYDDADILI